MLTRARSDTPRCDPLAIARQRGEHDRRDGATQDPEQGCADAWCCPPRTGDARRHHGDGQRHKESEADAWRRLNPSRRPGYTDLGGSDYADDGFNIAAPSRGRCGSKPMRSGSASRAGGYKA
jgi:hypothetical protein